MFQRAGLSVPAFAGTTAATDDRGLVISVLEAQSRRSSDVVVLDKGIRQSAIELRAHEADVDIPLSVQTSSPFFLERSYPRKTNKMRDF